MPFDDNGVLVNTDIAAALGNPGFCIAIFGQKAPDILPRFSQWASGGQHQKLNHMPGIVPEPLYCQQVMTGDRQMDRLQCGASFSSIFSTAQP